MGVDDGEELHGRQLRRVRLSVHQPLDHLNNLLPKVLHIHLLQDALYACDRLNQKNNRSNKISEIVAFSSVLPSREQLTPRPRRGAPGA